VIVRVIRTYLAHWAYAAAYRSSLQRAAVLPDWLRYNNLERPIRRSASRLQPSGWRVPVNNVLINYT
jgi:hypothetical protein